LSGIEELCSVKRDKFELLRIVSYILRLWSYIEYNIHVSYTRTKRGQINNKDGLVTILTNPETKDWDFVECERERKTETSLVSHIYM
jgi:hypothetical protein